MRRTFGLIVLVAAMGSAPACLAQEQQQQPQRPNDDRLQNEYVRRELAPVRIVPAKEYAKGVEALKAKRYKIAVRRLARVTDVAPKKADAWRGLGAAYAGEMRWDASRRAYKRALYLAPDDITSHAGLGLALLALNDPKAQQQAEWLKARTEACNNTCPEAPILKALEAGGPFAQPSSS